MVDARVQFRVLGGLVEPLAPTPAPGERRRDRLRRNGVRPRAARGALLPPSAEDPASASASASARDCSSRRPATTHTTSAVSANPNHCTV